MNYTFNSPKLSGRIRAISSKSEAHRLLICAALGNKETKILCTDTNDDINATVSCLNSLGADIVRTNDGFSVSPIKKAIKKCSVDCGESGSTLRFLLPIIAALGVECDIYMHGRLPMRPLSPLYELLSENGVSLSKQGSNPLHTEGKLSGKDFSIAANVSSQFISGLLFALPLCENPSTLTVTGKEESAHYVEMTLDALSVFGADIVKNGNTYKISPTERYNSPTVSQIGGDWSNAAFFLVAAAIGKTELIVTNLDPNSRQGDKEILSVLEKMGAMTDISSDGIRISSDGLRGTDIDASQIPDLVPILALAASVAEGQTRIYNASRLRLKESDRIESVCATLTSLGADVKPTDDGMIINGVTELCGGVVSSFGDHRIAMSAAIASTVSKNPVTVEGIEAVNKSYPAFISDFETLAEHL